MGKVKIKRKSTLIDMTAMSDVTVLLLTFFMLTSTFLQKEPAVVITPASVSEEKVPVQNLLTVLIAYDANQEDLNKKGKIFISVAGDQDSTYSSEKMRAEILKTVVADYNSNHKGNPIQLSSEDVNTFAKTNMFGLPLGKLSEWLKLDQTKRDEMLDPTKNPGAGIPVDMTGSPEKPNEFQMWLKAAYNSSNSNLQQAVKDGKGIAVKADQGTPYEVVQVVMDNLQTMKMNKFSLMTALKTEEQ